jgi:hypothetical protein
LITVLVLWRLTVKVKFEHVIDAPIQKVIEAYKSREFYVEKIKNSGALSVEVLERHERDDGTIFTKAKVVEKSRVPAFLRKSETDEYVDENTLDPKASIMKWKITPTRGADKVFLWGDVQFFDAGGGKTKVVFTTEIQVKIPFVGGQVEKYALSNTEEECAKQAQFIRDWVAKH